MISISGCGIPDDSTQNSHVHIGTVVKSLKKCTSLKVQNTFADRKVYKTVSEDIAITDREKIERLINVISADMVMNVEYRTIPQGVKLSTFDILEIYIYRDDVEIGWLYVLGQDIIKVHGSPLKYQSSDRLLIRKVRSALGVGGAD
jgi:hypothetical protein